MSGAFGVVSAIVMIALGGILHGHYSNRWGQPDNMMDIGAKLKQVPLSIGEWSSNGDIELSETTLTLLECMGYLNRVYVSKSTGESVSVALTFGPKGPIAVHTPEICYSSRSVTAGDKRKSIENDFDGNRNSLWELIFTSNDIEKSKLHVTYPMRPKMPPHSAVIHSSLPVHSVTAGCVMSTPSSSAMAGGAVSGVISSS